MSLTPLTADALAGTTHGFFTRQGGVSGGLYDSLNCGLGSDDARADVLVNRDRVRQALGAAALVTAHQTHSADALYIDAPPAPSAAGLAADALVTDVPGLAVGALAADCGPVLLADTKNGVIGAAHSGWRGAFDGILQNTVACMAAHGAERPHIRAVLGPCISQTAYEVGPEFIARFEDSRPDDIDLFVPSMNAGHFMFDLPGFIVRQLQAAGVAATHLARCTYAEEALFFSYRRTTHRGEADYGRQISAVCLPG